MKASILKPDFASEFFTPERCYIVESSKSDCDSSVSIAHARVRPGVTTMLHSLDSTDERYIILKGRGQVEVGPSLVADVEANDVVLIPSGVSQRITNTGTADLLFYCICTPPFKPSCYRTLE